MKELSIEEKAKRYDEAIKKAEPLYKAAEPMSGCNVIIETLFPELAESEDERIRKYIINFINLNKGTNLSPEDADRMLAWLEKQGEITKEWSEMKFNNIWTELQEMVALKQKTEQGEQNPSDVSKQEDIELTEFEDALYTTFSDIWQDYMLGKEINVVDFVREHSDELLNIANKQKPTEWSEEDQHLRNVCINACRYLAENFENSTEHYQKGIDWLKSLRPQEQNITSKEFEDAIREIKTRIAQCNGFNRKNREEVFGLIDSLRPQNRWKPSDEQMETLWSATEKYLESDNKNVRKLRGKVLESLYEDLKKLMEE